MKGFSDVDIMLHDRPLDHFPKSVVPIAVELLPNSENLYQFEHPENAVYVFGPEDGSVDPAVRALCHRRVFIPTRHCVNLAAAVYLVLYDRKFKQYLAGTEPLDTVQGTLNEVRMWPNTGRPDAHVWDIALE